MASGSANGRARAGACAVAAASHGADVARRARPTSGTLTRATRRRPGPLRGSVQCRGPGPARRPGSEQPSRPRSVFAAAAEVSARGAGLGLARALARPAGSEVSPGLPAGSEVSPGCTPAASCRVLDCKVPGASGGPHLCFSGWDSAPRQPRGSASAPEAPPKPGEWVNLGGTRTHQAPLQGTRGATRGARRAPGSRGLLAERGDGRPGYWPRLFYFIFILPGLDTPTPTPDSFSRVHFSFGPARECLPVRLFPPTACFFHGGTVPGTPAPLHPLYACMVAFCM